MGKSCVDRLKEARVAGIWLRCGGFLCGGGISAFRNRLSAPWWILTGVDASNINRQIYALHSTMGMEKAALARDRVLDINPACKVELKNSFVNADTLPEFLSEDLDMVVGCH